MADLESRAESIFFAAMERASPAERAHYVAEACADDVELQRRVERLLGAQLKISKFLESPPSAELNDAAGEIAADIAADIARNGLAASDEYLNTTIGPYKLLEQIGGGGMGVVYMAEQVHPVRRKVALKIIKPGMDSGQVIARFEAERQALTMMDHPNIARVLDAGTTGAGRPYFVMELVKGIPITDFCDQARLDTDQRLALFIQVCQAVQHAHQKGIIHRDIKPRNVLVTLHERGSFIVISSPGMCWSRCTMTSPCRR
jgi:eukaryotic-like serine/threonine-protein kinase